MPYRPWTTLRHSLWDRGAHAMRSAGLPLLIAATMMFAGTSLIGCGASGTSRPLEGDTSLRQLEVGVLLHPDRMGDPKADPNAAFYDYVNGMPEADRPFSRLELTTEPGQMELDGYLSLNVDINYVTQVHRVANWPKILTLYLYAVFGFPTYQSSAHYHLSATYYGPDGEIRRAWYVHEPVTFNWDNQYWAPEPDKPENLRFAFERMLQDIRRDFDRDPSLLSQSPAFPTAGDAEEEPAEDAGDESDAGAPEDESAGEDAGAGEGVDVEEGME